MSGIQQLMFSALVYLVIAIGFFTSVWTFLRLTDFFVGAYWGRIISRITMICQVFLAFSTALLKETFAQIYAIDRRFAKHKWLRRITYACAPPALAVLVGIGSAFWYIYQPSSKQVDVGQILDWHAPTIGRITDHGGRPVMLAFREARDEASYDEIAPSLRAAIRAGEDKYFPEHDGWYKPRTFYVTCMTVLSKVFRFPYRPQGASTMNQQVARKTDPDVIDIARREKQHKLAVDTIFTRTLQMGFGPVLTNRIARKLPEIRSAVRMENALEGYFTEAGSDHPRDQAKEAIFTVYANMAYFGHGVYGVKYASRFWFNKEMFQLTPDEAAFIASLLPAPEIRGRITENPEDRAMKMMYRNFVLQRMVEIGYLTPKEYAEYSAQPLVLSVTARNEKTDAPAAVDAAMTELKKLGFTQDQLFNGDINIELTIDIDVQRTVNAAVANGRDRYTERFKVDAVQMAFVVLANTDAAIKAIYGGVVPDGTYNNYATYNRAMYAKRQPGSTFKIFDIVAAVMAGLTPDSIIQDRRFVVPLGGGQHKVIENYDGKEFGPIPLWKATEMSRNLAFMHMMHDIGGARPAIYWAREMGVKSHLDPYITTVIGANGIKPIEVTNGLRTICGGTKAEPYIINRITGRDGTELYRHEHLSGVKEFAVPMEKRPLIKALLRGTVVLDRGTNHSLNNLSTQLMGKTGTSNDHRDAWDQVCTDGAEGHTFGGWAGYDEFSKMMPGNGLSVENRASGGSVMAKVCGEIVENSYGKGKPFGIAPVMSKEVERLVQVYRAKAYGPPVTTK